MLRYTQECTENPADLVATTKHIVAELSSVASEKDDPEEFADEVRVINAGFVGDSESVKLIGVLDRPARAPYLTAMVMPVRGIAAVPTPKTFAQLVQDRLSVYGVPWKNLPGAQLRGNGQVWGEIEGAIMHHTATPLGPTPNILIQGRSDLAGPLCNTAGEADGTVAFVAHFPANHAGAGAGKSMGPLPVTGLFNRRVWGHEIVYPGTSPMTQEQYRSAVLLSRAICDVLGKGPEVIRAHAETSSTGKWDPGYANGKTIDMNEFRRQVGAVGQEEEPDMDKAQNDMLKAIYDQITGNGFKGWEAWPGGATHPNGKPVSWTLVDYLRGNDVLTREIRKMVAAMALKVDMNQSGEDSAKQIAALLKPEIALAVKDAVGTSNQDLVKQILDKLAARLAA